MQMLAFSLSSAALSHELWTLHRITDVKKTFSPQDLNMNKDKERNLT